MNSPRQLIRAAFLQDYRGEPQALRRLIPEVASKGYQAVFLSAGHEDDATIADLCQAAVDSGLDVMLFSGFMKYQYAYLATHPDQRLVQAGEDSDQDGLPTNAWGCPFNPVFQARYLGRLRRWAVMPGVVAVSVNDEADMRAGCYCQTCRDAYAEEIGGEMPSLKDAAADFWDDPAWRRFLLWRIERWNRIHRRMREAVREAADGVRVVFQASPIVDLCGRNPWLHAVDLSTMIDSLDGLCTDPYYTFHARAYDPPEVYLSEWCKFLCGVVPPGKSREIIPQGFSHPSFTRALDERDGLWAGLIPLACGIDTVIPYTYPLMEAAAPVRDAYESCFRHDATLKHLRPVTPIAVVHGGRTEILVRPLPASGPESYDRGILAPCTESLRHSGYPYGYVPDTQLSRSRLEPFSAIVLPEIACVDRLQAEAIAHAHRSGAAIVILGMFGTHDNSGNQRSTALLEERFGIRCTHGPPEAWSALTLHENLEACLPAYDEEAAGRYSEGTQRPVCLLRDRYRVAELPRHAEVLATADADGKPAVVLLPGNGQHNPIVWIAGFPRRVATHPIYGTPVRDRAHWLLPGVLRLLAVDRGPLWVEDWPPRVPMDEIRPLDRRWACTYEFLPLTGEGMSAAVIASYFREPATVRVCARVPPGQRCAQVTERITGDSIQATTAADRITVDLAFGFDDALKFVGFEFVKELDT